MASSSILAPLGMSALVTSLLLLLQRAEAAGMDSTPDFNVAEIFPTSGAPMASSSPAYETRCYCNLPECVSSNYMCKSASGRCFTEILDLKERPIRTRNGCMELLTKSGFEQNVLPKTCASMKMPEGPRRDLANRRKHTKDHVSEQTSSGSSEDGPLLKCCGDDFCNYGHNDILIHADPDVDNWLSPAKSAAELENERRSLQQAQWFKVVTIVVPILGGFILIILLAVGYHVYRKDSKRDLEYARHRLPARSDAHASPMTSSGTRTLLLDETRAKDCCCLHQRQQQHYRQVSLQPHRASLLLQQQQQANNGSGKTKNLVIHHCQRPDPHRHICVEHGCPAPAPTAVGLDYRLLQQMDLDLHLDAGDLDVDADVGKLQRVAPVASIRGNRSYGLAPAPCSRPMSIERKDGDLGFQT